MKRFTLLGAILLGTVIGCARQNPVADDAPKPDAPGQTPVADAKALDSYVMAEKPAHAISVRDALARKDGEKVVVSGRTPPDNVKPFNAAVAAFVMLAPEDLDRDEVKDEFECEVAATCPSCKKLLDQYGVRVELVDRSGVPLPTTMEGFRGIKPGSTITVEGTVQRFGKDNKLVRIVATKFYPG
jgi:hypothetical protein